MIPLPDGLTVGYVTSGDLSARLIELRSAGGPSHATTLAAPGWVIDARLKGGVQRRPVSYLEGAKVAWYRVLAPMGAVARTITALESQTGKPYDWRDIIDFAIPQRFQEPWRTPDAWICSELQAWAEEQGEVLPKLVTAYNRLAPADIMLANSARGMIPLAGPMF